jgi:hypothetical protein
VMSNNVTTAGTFNGNMVVINAAGNVFLNASVVTGDVTEPGTFSGSETARTGGISVTAGSAITGNASGRLITGAASVSAGTAGLGSDNAISGNITLSAGGAITLAAANALTTGQAEITGSSAGGADAANSGSITIQSADKVSSDGSTGKLDVSIGDVPVSTGNGTRGTFSVTTDGGAGDAGGIFVTSDSELQLATLAANGTGSQNVSISTTGGAALIWTNVAESLSGDSVSLDSGSGTLTIQNTSVALGAGSITLTADEIELTGGANSITTTGAIVLRQSTLAQDIDIVGAGGTAALDLTNTELNNFTAGFSSITIGRSDATSASILTVTGPRTFNSNVTLIGGGVVMGHTALLTGGTGVTVTITAVQGDICDGACGGGADTASNITVAANGAVVLSATQTGGIGSIGESADPLEVFGVTVLTVTVDGSFYIVGDTATNLTDLILTVDPAGAADSTYSLTAFDGMTFGSTGLVDAGANLHIEGIKVDDNENVAMNLTITSQSGDVILSDSENDNSSPTNLPAIDFSKEGGDISITTINGSILDEFEVGADDPADADYANILVKSNPGDSITLVAGGSGKTVGTSNTGG